MSDTTQLKRIQVSLIVIIALLAANLFLDFYWVYEEEKYNTPVYERIERLLEKEKYEEVLSFCNRTLSKNPKEPDALWGKAEALYQMKQYQKALIAFEKFKEEHPDWTEDANNYISICKQKLEKEK